MSINLRWRQFASWRRKNGLFCTIVSWIIIAIIAYTLLSAIWGYGHGWNRILAGWHIGATHDPLGRIKVTLTALGGVGAVGYLVIKYRERAALERGEADEKLVRAVQQLGDASPQVRIAGVYALADVADTYEGPYHQRVVDILCGYLRTDRLLKDANGDTRYATNDDGTPNYDQPLSADGAVESTILSVLDSHLKTVSENDTKENTSPGPWSHCTLNLHGATLTESIQFTGSHIGAFNVQDIKFAGHISFQDSVFADCAIFINSIFTQGVNFGNVRFDRQAIFSDATLKKKVNFTGTRFSDVYFNGSTFENKISFTLTTFTANVTFEAINCEKEIQFRGITFPGCVNLKSATFRQFADFTGVTFGGETILEYTKFKHGVLFLGAIFVHDTIFSNAEFNKSTDFTGAIFKQRSNFTGVTFNGDTSMWGVTFSHESIFHKVTFKYSVSFRRATFPRGANFMGSFFLNDVDFWETKLKSNSKHNEVDHFLNANFNPSPDVSLFFPESIKVNNEGLPEGAKWFTFDIIDNPAPSSNQHYEIPVDEQVQRDEIPPTDNFPKNGS